MKVQISAVYYPLTILLSTFPITDGQKAQKKAVSLRLKLKYAAKNK